MQAKRLQAFFIDISSLLQSGDSSSKQGTPSQRPSHHHKSKPQDGLEVGGGAYPTGTYPPGSRAAGGGSGQNSSAADSATSGLAASGGATLSRLHMLQQGPTPQESIKRQTLSARGLSDKEFTKHCRGFDGQIKVSLTLDQVIFAWILKNLSLK